MPRRSALALVLGKRIGWPKESFKPHNVPLVALGAGLLWFGWFGFNAGSELTADGIAAVAFVNTQVATAAGAARLDRRRVDPRRQADPGRCLLRRGRRPGRHHPGLWLHRPAGRRSLLGLVAGAVCALAVGLKYKLGYDDSLDVVGVHFVGGWIGSLSHRLLRHRRGQLGPATGLGASEGLFYGGGIDPARPAGARRGIVLGLLVRRRLR